MVVKKYGFKDSVLFLKKLPMLQKMPIETLNALLTDIGRLIS
jgi:hypothetical protein